MSAIESADTRRVFVLAFVLAAANPKNVIIVVSAATVIADATSVPYEQFIALAVFVLVASLGVAAPEVVRRILGDRSKDVLDAADRWMTKNSALVMSTVLLVLGVLLIANGLSGL